MPLYRVRRERCIPYEIVVRAPSMEDAEEAAFRNSEKWGEESGYWQDLETYELEEGDSEPALIVEKDSDEE